MGVGFAANKSGMLPEEANKYLSPLLMKITTPCLILANIATREVEEGMWGDIFKALGCFALYFVVFCFLGWVLCAKMMKLKGHEDCGVYMMLFASINNGFIGLPITLAIFGEDALFYMAFFQIVLVLYLFGPGILQITGIILAIAAILIVNSPEKEDDSRTTVTAPKALILLLLLGGSGDAMSKIYEELGPARYTSQYLLYTFAVALILCTLTALLRRQRFTKPDILFGCLVGLPNYYSARFLLLSLSEVPAVAAFPTFSIGTILLTGAAGVALFGEKMTKRQWIAIGIVIAAMVLLNI